MKVIQKLDTNWQYLPYYEEGMEKFSFLEGSEQVLLPHANIEMPYNYFDEKLFQFVSCYKLPFAGDKEQRGKLAVIRFEGVMTYAKVYLNGEYLGDHKGGYTPFEFDVTKMLNYKEDNVLTVVVDSTEREDIPPFGGQIDYLTYGGIYRDVTISYYDKVYMKNVKIETKNIYNDEKAMSVDLHLNNHSMTGEATVVIDLLDVNKKETVYSIEKTIVLEKEQLVYSLEADGIKDVALWDLDHPNLYTAKIKLTTDLASDIYETRIGFRECKFRPDGFFLNNNKVKIMGLNRHQSYPFAGYAMPKRMQELDAEILKNDLHVNTVRTSHYPQLVEFIDRCDEIGLLVFEEIPGWQHIGDDAWKEVAVENVREMIERDWNHPSIIIWGVRINESQDDDSFYERTNKLARDLDATRQTGGVRYIENSHLLEDVYTMNDFICGDVGSDVALREQQNVTGLNKDVPYLITEYNGHMYPTKKFDQEERQMEHVLRHLRVIDKSKATDNISGAIGWCMFDYNTHKDFGSGDRICYHGVTDIYRIKKFAAYAYKSQVSPEIETVLKPVTLWARGERAIGGIIPFVILTNCDYITLQYGDFEARTYYPAKDEFEGLDYPPVIIRMEDIDPDEMGLWGMKWENCLIKGYINDKEVDAVEMAQNPLPTTLSVKVDYTELKADEKDATRIVIEALDQCGNNMPYIEEMIEVEINGVGRIIGPNKFVLTGGSRGVYIETMNQVGTIEVTINSTMFDEKVIKINVQ